MKKMNNKEIDSFCKKMDELMPKLTRQFLKKGPSMLARGDITVPHVFTLELLDKRGSCNMGELAENLSITTSAVTGLIDRMLKAGLVERIRGDKDRRIVKVETTKKGRNIIKKIITQRHRMLIESFSQISKEDREKYIEILEKIYLVLEKR